MVSKKEERLLRKKKKVVQVVGLGRDGGMEATQGDRTEEQSRGKADLSAPGRERWQEGGNEDIFQGETLQSRSLWKY